MGCTKRNPNPPCAEGFYEKLTPKGDLCCYKGVPKKTKKKSPSPEKKKSPSPEKKKSPSPEKKKSPSPEKKTKKITVKKESLNLSLLDLERYNKRVGYYDELTNCEKDHSKGSVVTNFKYTTPRNTFDHLYYHVGDWNDMERYVLLDLRMEQTKANRFKQIKLNHTIFNDYDIMGVDNALRYMFYHMKKGIYVKIRNNKLTFVPFSNVEYKNPHYTRLYLDDDEKTLLETLKTEMNREERDVKKIKEIQVRLNDRLRRFKDEKKQRRVLENNRELWMTNNCNIRSFGTGNMEGDINHHVFKDMFTELCKSRELNDCEFCINVRDFPVLRRDFLDAYDELYDDVHSRTYIPNEYQKTMCPIMSCSKKKEHADMLMVNADDWMRASGKYYMDYGGCTRKEEINERTNPATGTAFKDKINKIVFRGSATGCGLTVETNIRLRAAKKGSENEDIMDVGITDWNARMKKPKNSSVNIIDEMGLSFGLKNKITDDEKFSYKYILNLDGHVSAYRLGSELNSGSVIIMPESENKLWFSHMMKPYKHYVPINENLEDIRKKYDWCESHEKECVKIIENARNLYGKVLSKKGILDYMGDAVKVASTLRKKVDFNKGVLDGVRKEMKIAIITIFRDDVRGGRENQRRHFLEIMNGIFNECKYKIFIVEQSQDDEKFNIGKLKNIGFELAKKADEFSHYVFTDIDMIPDTKLMKYYLMRPPEDGPISLAMDGTRYHSRREYYSKQDKNVKPFFGGVCSFTEEQFLMVNGYPNNIYGWGGEDDELEYRINHNGLAIVYPKEGSVIDLEEIDEKVMLDPKEKVAKNMGSKEKEKMRWEKTNKSDTWDENGIKNLYYTEESVTKIGKNVIQVLVNLDKDVDMALFPEWFPDTPMSEKEIAEYKKEIRQIKWKVKVVSASES